MPDGIQKTVHTVDSTTQNQPFHLYNPTNVREVLQRQIQSTVDHEIDRIVEFGTENSDGRLFANSPGEEQLMENEHGQFYHIIGVSRGGDLSVAAP